MKAKFIVFGEPVGKGRPRFVRSTGRTYTPDKTTAYENKVRAEYRREGSAFWNTEPLRVKITACFGVPKSASKSKRERMLNGSIRPTKKPDADNIVKIICDALNGVAYHDDTQVVEVLISKIYSDVPMVLVEIDEVD